MDIAVTDTLCVIHELADLLSRDTEIRAVLLDAHQRRVSFACMPGCGESAKQADIERILRDFRPDDVPACATDPWRVDCKLCARGQLQAMPTGIRLISLPGAGVLIERESCATAPRFWKWRQFPWLKVQPIATAPGAAGHDWKAPMALAAICGATTLAGFVLEKSAGVRTVPALLLYIGAYLSGSFFALRETWELLRKRILDIHFLMLAVAVGAASIGHWWEGAVLMFLFSISGALEDLAMQRTERAIDSLFKAAPRHATLRDPQGRERLVPVESIEPGMVLVVRPGEQFPVDAEVIEGASAADESNLTGESVPVDKSGGDRVLAGTLNLWGRIDCRVLKPADESALSKVIRLIREARESKAPAQRFTDRFGSVYTYGILGASVVMLAVWWKLFHLPFEQAFYRTMTLLVVASPCALVLSIPSAILAGIAAGARRGILFRGGVAIEKLAEIHRVALDKTGTLTTGHLKVLRIESCPPGRTDELFARAAALAQNSAHPASQAIARQAHDLKLKTPGTSDFRSITGQGVAGFVAGRSAKLGRRSMFDGHRELTALPHPEPGTTEVLYDDGDVCGRIVLQDDVRTASRPLLDRLYAAGLRLTMLSGDRPEAARAVAEQVGLREYEAGLTPEAKVEKIKAWTAAGEKTAMVGDGVNDAPSLAAAYVGVAMGMRGSDAALEQADIVLMRDRLDRFAIAYELSRRARRIIVQNLTISLGSVVVLVLAAFAGVLPLTVGVVGHEGSTVVVVLNSLRLLLARFEEDST